MREEEERVTCALQSEFDVLWSEVTATWKKIDREREEEEEKKLRQVLKNIYTLSLEFLLIAGSYQLSYLTSKRPQATRQL